MLIQASDDQQVRITGTNLEIAISGIAAAKVAEAGAIAVPAKTFVDLINIIPGDAVVDLKVKESAGKEGVKEYVLNLSCKTPKLSNNIKCIAAEEFPLVPLTADVPGLEFDAKTFNIIAGSVVFAAATDESRPILTAIHIKVKDKQALFEGADGFRLGRQEFLQDVADFELNIPARALDEVSRISAKYTAAKIASNVTIGVTGARNQGILACGEFTVVSQLIEGAFPDLNAVMPKGAGKTIITVNRDELHKAFRSADIFAREAAHTSRLKVIPGTADQTGMVQVLGVSAETGDNTTEIDATIQGPAIEIAFNTKYLVDVLGMMDGRSVVIELNTATSTAVIRPVTDDAGKYRHLVMPMHLGK